MLDIFREGAGADTLFLTTFTYGRGLAGRQISGHPFPDHGAQEPDTEFFHGGNYATPHAEFYRHTALKQTRAPDHGDLDIVAAVLPAAQASAGMKAFCSIEDVCRPDVPGLDRAAEVDLRRRRTATLCPSTPRCGPSGPDWPPTSASPTKLTASCSSTSTTARCWKPSGPVTPKASPPRAPPAFASFTNKRRANAA